MSVPTFDPQFAERLPLPLAQLYVRAHNAKTPVEHHQAAYYLWEAAIKVLASVAIVEFARLEQHDEAIAQRLKCLARPSLGHWWEFARLLTKHFADRGDAGFTPLCEFLLGGRRHDLPRLTALDGALRQHLSHESGARSTVRVQEVFDRLVAYRNQTLGHGAFGLLAREHYERMGDVLVAGAWELLSHADMLAGRRLIYISDVRRTKNGDWRCEQFELLGQSGRPMEALAVASALTDVLPRPQEVYLRTQREAAVEERAARENLTELASLHPLLQFDASTGKAYLLNARRGERGIEFLDYVGCSVVKGDALIDAQRELLARLLDLPVYDTQAEAWAKTSLGEEEGESPASIESTGRALRHLGDFELVSRLGRGGMGEVFRANHLALGRQVALKKLLQVGDPKAEARFSREIRALGRIDHPNLVKIFTSGSEGDDWYYAMELVEGATLAAICRQLSNRGDASQVTMQSWGDSLSTACEESRRAEKPLAGAAGEKDSPAFRFEPAQHGSIHCKNYVAHLVELFRQLADALQSLHEVGVVHRDVKPENIIVRPDGSHAVLLDLGLAQLADEVEGRLTRTRQFIGTLRYASPEQVLAVRRVDGRTDIYSLGATLWELLTLKPLFGAGDETPAPTLMEWTQHRDVESPRKHNRHVSSDLAAVVLKCLEKDPDRRYATAHDLAADLQRVQDEERPVAARSGMTSYVRRHAARIRRHPARLIAFAACVLLLAFAGHRTVQYWQFERPTQSYFKSMTLRWQVISGIDPISETDARRRNSSVRITRRGSRGPVIKAELVDGYLRPHPTESLVYPSVHTVLTDPDEAATSVEYLDMYFDELGRPQYTTCTARNRYGVEVWSFLFDDYPRLGHYTFVSRGGARLNAGSSSQTAGSAAGDSQPWFALGQGATGLPARIGASQARYEVFTYESNESGLEESQHFYDYQDDVLVPKPSADGVYGVESDFDEAGRYIEARFLNAEHEVAPGADGVSRHVMTYNADGNVASERFYNGDRLVTPTVGEAAGFDFENSPEGNLERAYFVTEEGTRVSDPEQVASRQLEYGSRGELKSVELHNAAGDLLLGPEGWALMTYEYGESGELLTVRFLGPDKSSLVLGSDGIAGWNSEFYSDGRERRQDYVGLNGQPPCRHVDGNLGWSATYDSGRLETMTYFGYEEGAPVYREVYDSQGRIVQGRYLAADEITLMVESGEGVAGWNSEYFPDGLERKREYVGVDGLPTRHEDGNLGWTATYEAGLLKTETFFGYDEGAPAMRKTYNADGQAFETRFLAADETTLVLHPEDAVAGWNSEYNENGTEISRVFVGLDGQPPCRHSDGHAGWRAVFEGDQVQSLTSFGYEDGAPVRQAMIDEHGRIVQRRNFAEDQATLILDSEEGLAGWNSTFSPEGLEVERIFVGVNGEPPCRHKDGNLGWRAAYEDGVLKTKSFFGYAQGAPVVRKTYDADEQVVEVRYLDEDETTLVLHSWEDIAGWNSELSAEGLEVKVVYVGLNGEPPCWNSDDALGWTAEYEDGVLKSKTMFGCSKGTLILTYTYDSDERVSEAHYFTAEGKEPALGPRGYHEYRCEYASGREIRREYRDLEGSPVPLQAVVRLVLEDMPAARAGVLPGDVFVEYNGVRGNQVDLINAIQEAKQMPDAGPVEATFRRGEEELVFEFPRETLGVILRDEAMRANSGGE